MRNELIFKKLCEKVINLELETIEDTVRESLDKGVNPVDIIDKGLAKGASVMGDRFEKGEAFLTELVLAGETMKAGIEVLKPEMLKNKLKRKSLGKIVLGTVKGDIHDIGKEIVRVMLEAAGFEVFDLGVDVPPDRFIQKLEEIEPQVIGMSALLSTTVPEQKVVIDELKNANLRDKVKVIVGGAAVTSAWVEEIEADGYADNAVDTVRMVKQLLGICGGLE
jgi:5-methyltetrahydrofolate--homocysteine methyltransferase